jgi:enoyl-CoA hydratase/carnithine racemase
VIRAVVLTGAGPKAFCAGADLKERSSWTKDDVRRWLVELHAGLREVERCPKPWIAAVNGLALGGGCELALACDLRIAADDARFGITPAKLGIVYNLTSTKQLVDAVGPAWAKQILCSGDIIDARTALRIGLVNELHPDPAARAFELAGTIAGRAQLSVRGAKAIVNRIMDGQTEEDDAVRALYAESAASADYAEGVRAFLSKRPPRF